MRRLLTWNLKLTLLCMIVLLFGQIAVCQTADDQSPSPLLKKGQPAQWWFAFKFNAETFPRAAGSAPTCLFGGTAGGKRGYSLIGQDYVYASDTSPTLVKGSGYLGDSTDDPLGATFDEVYNGNLSYVIWNDQFYRDPLLQCEGANPKSNDCEAPWGHSKGVLAWDAKGNGFLMQVTTPDWPGSGNSSYPRAEGNSLGCTMTDDDVDLSQDFFALKLTEADLLKVLAALAEEGAVTDTSLAQIVNTGGPQEVKDAVSKLGAANATATFTNNTLSSGVRIIAKAGGLNVPPWQMVSALLNKASLRVANYWQGTLIYSTAGKSTPTCWSPNLNAPGAVKVATTGIWGNTTIGLSGTAPTGSLLGANHAKIGVSTDPGSTLTIFGDMNQDGVLNAATPAACARSQNARGGMFFVLDNSELHDSVAGLLKGNTAPMKAPVAKAKTTPAKAQPAQ
jgi:Deoxyribonuclease II